MRVVLDSSVWLAGIGSQKGFASETIYLCHTRGNIELFISDYILEEIQRNLIKKLDFNRNDASEAIKIIENLCSFKISPVSSEIEKIQQSIFAKDKPILALVEKVKADYLVTFDRKHLLPLKRYQGTQIVEPKDFVGGLSKS